MKIMPNRRHLRTWLAVYVTPLALFAGACNAVDDGSVSRVSQAQTNFTPTSCTGDTVPDDFVNQCVLAGGETAHCDGGVAYCCRACHPGEAGGCDEYCSQNPDDVSRQESASDEGIVIVDSMDPGDPSDRAPSDQPVIGGIWEGIDGSGLSLKCSTECQWFNCFNACVVGSPSNYCEWQCTCTVVDGKDRFTCELENPYIDLHEQPPPPKTAPTDPAAGKLH
jgi:hypothetical protein